MADGGGERTKTKDVDELLADVDDITGGNERTRRGSGESASATTEPPTADTTRATADPTGSTTETTDSTLRERLDGVFSPKTFVVAVVLAAVGTGVGGFIPLVGGLLAFVGVFGAMFVLGALGGRQHYPEAGLASGLVVGGGAIQRHFILTFVGNGGAVFFLVSAVIGLVCGLLGHYFGRDLRDGLTREL